VSWYIGGTCVHFTCARRFVLLKLTTDRHEASRGLFATAELYTCFATLGSLLVIFCTLVQYLRLVHQLRFGTLKIASVLNSEFWYIGGTFVHFSDFTLRSTFCTIEAITTDRHEASRGLFATAELGLFVLLH